MFRSIPARRAIRTIGNKARYVEVAGTRGLSNRVKAAGGIMVEKKGTRAQATAAPQVARYSFVLSSVNIYYRCHFQMQFQCLGLSHWDGT